MLTKIHFLCFSRFAPRLLDAGDRPVPRGRRRHRLHLHRRPLQLGALHALQERLVNVKLGKWQILEKFSLKCIQIFCNLNERFEGLKIGLIFSESAVWISRFMKALKSGGELLCFPSFWKSLTLTMAKFFSSRKSWKHLKIIFSLFCVPVLLQLLQRTLLRRLSW